MKPYFQVTVGDGASVPCPHCDKDIQYTGDAIRDGEELEDDCPYCGKSFFWIGVYDFYFEARVKE